MRITLARVHAHVDALKLANWQVASALTDGDLNPADASAMKVFGTELRVERAAGPHGRGGGVGLAARRRRRRGAARSARSCVPQAPVGTFGGGVNEVQREIIALAGLGMPRAAR